VLNDEIHYAREGQKMRLRRSSTPFHHRIADSAGRDEQLKAFFFNPILTKHTTTSEFSVVNK
jgi:hypothetical protein